MSSQAPISPGAAGRDPISPNNQTTTIPAPGPFQHPTSAGVPSSSPSPPFHSRTAKPNAEAEAKAKAEAEGGAKNVTRHPTEYTSENTEPARGRVQKIPRGGKTREDGEKKRQHG
ncbi:hypothetical protein EYC84_005216 [Monilinia fructicola]|uniref:Uncharacterized protein n=1 Tax=Monilinia fructicola TaxID=38448 RepID=A0A5M9JYQ7_MONFR|nr:hypothetical protein EYC84_005216 [Monilinia fructicola]